MQRYKSPYQAYSFLDDPASNVTCDFEIATDLIACRTGALASMLRSKGEGEHLALADDLDRIEELTYHANPALRTRLMITPEETDWLLGRAKELASLMKKSDTIFRLPAGTAEACLAHELRARSNGAVRLLYKAVDSGGKAPDGLFDFFALCSRYFHALAMRLNELAGVGEKDFYTRNYTIR